MKVLLSIKPEYAEKIFEGTKKYEFRKRVFSINQANKVIVYASSPVKKVVGEFIFESIIEEKPEILWNYTKKEAGITKNFFDDYFRDKNTAYAIKIKTTRKYRTPLDLKNDFGLTYAPQSYVYVK
ncbi:MAG: ASCH domain-containing protein [Thermodesulfobacteriota bacterium]